MSDYHSIEKSAKKRGATVLYCDKVIALHLSQPSKNSQKNKIKIQSQSKKIILITDCFIEQYDIDHIKTPEKKAFWFDLLRISVNTKNNFFSLEFAYPEPTESDIANEIDPQNYIFQLHNKNGDLFNFYRIIIEMIQRILTKQEIRDLIFFDDEEFYDDDDYFEKFNFTPRGAFARFLILNMKKKNDDLSQNVKESVAEYLLMKYNDIYIKNENCIENCLDILMSSLKTLPYVESISVPTFNKFIQVDSFSIIANFLKKPSNIQHIEMRGPCLKPRFHDLCRSIENMGVIETDNKGKRKSQCKLTGVTFDNFELNTKQIASIKTAAISGRLLSLGINNINPPSTSNSKPTEDDTIIDYIVDTLLSPHLTSSLRILSLDGNPDIDIQKLFENSGSIQKISLKKCGLEITHVFEALASIRPPIDSIDLSDNECTNSDIDKALTSLAHPLLRIDVNNVTWSDDCLESFLRGIVKIYEIQDDSDEYEKDQEDDEDSQNNLKDTFLNSEENVNSGLNSVLVTLSMSHIKASKSEWQNVRTFFEDNRKRLSIEQFSYNENKISSHFIVFLRKSMKKLKRLFLNNCPNFSQFASILATNFISKSSTLSELYIEKADTSQFPEDSSFSAFFKKCCESTSLRLLDVKMCSIEVEGLTSLANLIKSCRSGNLNQIAFDGSGCKSFDDIAEFVLDCKEYVKESNKKNGKKTSKSGKSYRRLFIELPSYDLRNLKASEDDIESLKIDLYDLTLAPKDEDDLWCKPHEFYIMQKNDRFPVYFHPLLAAKLRRKIDQKIEIERSLRKSGKSSYKSNSSYHKSVRDGHNADAGGSNRIRSQKVTKSNRNIDNAAKSYRNGGFDGFERTGRSNRNKYDQADDDDSENYGRRRKGFLFVGKDEISDSEDDQNQFNSKKAKLMGKSKYDEEDDDDVVDVRSRNVDGKKKVGFRPGDWEFPLRSLEKVDEFNENLFIQLQDKFSLKQLMAEASNKNDDNRF